MYAIRGVTKNEYLKLKNGFYRLLISKLMISYQKRNSFHNEQ